MRRTLWVATPPVVRRMHATATLGLVEPERRRTAAMLAANGVDDPEAWLAAAEQRVLDDLHRHGPSTARAVGQRLPDLRHPLALNPGKAYAGTQSAHTRVLTLLGFTAAILRTRPSSWVNGAYAYAAAEDWLPGGLAGVDPGTAARELAGHWLRRFGPGNGGPTLWVDGRIVGAWAQSRDGQIHTHYFEPVPARRRRELDERIADVRAMIGDTRFTVRFPSDIHDRLVG